MDSAFKFTVDQDGIANILFDLPNEKVNKLSPPIVEELERLLDAAVTNKEIKALTISSGKPDIFIAGADLKIFERLFEHPDPKEGLELIKTGHRVFNKLQNLPFPSFALINGACLGGGTELALACTYRIVSDSPKTQIGLPEATLGIVPGWGGTQRMPRLVGLVEGLSLILGGKPVKAQKAFKIKLADALLPAEFFETQSRDFVKKCLTPEGKKRVLENRKRKGLTNALLEGNPIGRSLVYSNARKDVLKKTKGHYPAPLIALDLIKESYPLPLDQGLNKEIEIFQNNFQSGFAPAKNLIHLFFVGEALKKDAGGAAGAKPNKVSSAGVIGAGTMGSGIAWLFSYRDIPVRMKDIDWNAVGKGYGAAYGIYKKMLKEKRLKPSEVSLKFHQITGTVDYSGFKNADLIIEAAVESLNLKHQILRELEKVVRPDAIIASNTSSLTIADMGAVMEHPERFVGMHFFNPANRMPLVEVVAGEKTSPTAVATAVDVCRKLGKTPIVVRDCPGFLVNRIFVTCANEVIRMYEEGADFKQIEKAMLDFGMPMSPFLLADEVGNDVGYKVSKVFENAYGKRMEVPPLLTAMNDNKLYGKKNAKGFYLYNGDKKEINPEAEKLRNGLIKTPKSFTDADIIDRTFLATINEAARCLEEKVVSDAAHLDMAMIMGVGFPPFRGGVLCYADSLGIDQVVSGLQRLQKQYGERFKPCQLLLTMQQNKTKFFS